LSNYSPAANEFEEGKGVSAMRLKSMTTLVLALALFLTPAASQAGEGMDKAKGIGAGIGLVTANVGYFCGKLFYAVLGTVVTPVAWAVSGGDREVARHTFYPSVRGDYLLSMENIKGQEPFDFIGRMPGEQRPGQVGSRGPIEEGF
jgi:hypothetical protein